MAELFDSMTFQHNHLGQISFANYQTEQSKLTVWFRYNKHGLLYQYGMTKDGEPIAEDDGSFGHQIDYITKICNIADESYVELWMSCLNESLEIGTFRNGYSTRKEKREKGCVIEEFYYDSPNGLQIPDLDGNYGKRYDYSENNTTKTINLDKDGNPQNNNKGICTTIEKKDDQDRKVQELIFDSQNIPAYDEIGDCGTICEYDDINRHQIIKSLGEDGNPHNNSQGFAYKHVFKDDQNRTIKELYYDVNHNPINVVLGTYGIKIEYKDYETTTIYLGKDGNPCNNSQGYAYRIETFDENKRKIRELIFDADDNPAFDNIGDSGTAWKYEDQENKVTIISLGADGMPHNNNQGYSEKIILIDSGGNENCMYKNKDNEIISLSGSDLPTIRKVLSDREEEIVSIDKDENPTNNNQGYAYKYLLKDDNGRTIKELIFDVDRNPAFDNVGDSGTAWEYNDEENEVTTISLGADGTPHNNNNGFTYQRVKRDAKGRELKVVRLDKDGNLVCDGNGDYGVLREYDDQSNIITTILLGADGKMHNNNGIAYKVETLDKQGRTIKEFFYDIDRNPAFDNVGDSGTAWEYNDEENEVTTISLGADGTPHNNNNGFAYLKVRRDAKGRELKVIRLDINICPIPDSNGDYGLLKEYDDINNEITTISLGTDGKPHNNLSKFAYKIETKDYLQRTIRELIFDADHNPAYDSVGDSGTLYVYNDEENEVTIISLGVNGEPHNNNQGYAYKELYKDVLGRTIKELIFDVDHNPAFDNVGDSGTAWEYNDEENEVTTISLGVNGEPHNNNQGYAYKEIYKDSQNRTIKELIFDANHNPAFDSMSDSGKLHVYYDEENKETTISLGVDGKPHNNNQGYAFKICTITNDVKIYKYLDINKKPIPQVIRDLGDGQAEVENLNIDGSSRKGTNGVVYRRIFMDELGRPVKQLYFDVNHTPATNDIGDYGVVYEYIDNDSRCYYITSLDINENPRINSNGFSKRYVLEDVEERVIKELTYGLTDEPVCDEDGCYGYEYRYTSDQNEKITISLGANGSQIETRSGWAYKKEVKDTSDRVIEVYYYDAQNQPTDNFGFKIHYFDDENGTRLITRIGRDGNPSEGRNGICRIVELMDNNGNETTLYYDLKGNRVEKKWWRNILKFLKIE